MNRLYASGKLLLLAVCIATPAFAQTIAVSDSGNADAGIGSRAVANVAANDSIGGLPAMLGSGGNAVVTRSGTWPSGITLTPAGSVNTAASLAAGNYSVGYQLCDTSVPPVCATAIDTINVTTAVLVATPDSGTADAGIASRPIANVAVNDTINGNPVVLGSTGTVAQTGTWPSGIALTPATGAISTTVAVAAGSYPVAYQLCDKNVPPNCVGTTDTVTVINASIVATPESGSADAGVASRPIANVAANDTVNGMPATLTASGNATVAQVGSWPSGIALTPGTGAISTSAAVTASSYPITYRLCDRNVPPDCVTATDTVNVATASIVANPDSGTADTGIGSRAIANVAANDTISGAPAVLGSSGNATVAQVGTWPSGIALTPSSGAVNTAVTLATGSYNFVYKLCDRNTPPQCATATDTVNVISASIVAAPDSGTAYAGTGAKPILNVAANDTINGADAILGSGGNATVAQIGTWPTGIVLSPSTGTVSTSASLAPGPYTFVYQLCDLNAPANCTTATDSISVSFPVGALPVSGSIVVGTAGTPIGNVVIKDTVNGTSATLGSSGNATIAPVGNWPSQLTLNVTTGAISANSSIALGTYNVSYQLCAKAAPTYCVTATPNVIVTPAFVEVLASATVIGDIEFDSARDGVLCTTCNDGQGNSRFNWTDRNSHLWVNGIDPATGHFVPDSGRQTLVDSNAFFWLSFGNGPEWAFSTPAGSQTPISQIVFTRWTPGTTAVYQNAGAAMATQTDGVWNVAFLPGAISPGKNSILPTASQCATDPVALSMFVNLNSPPQAFIEPISTADGTAPMLTSFGSYSNLIGERWVPCTHWLTFQGNVTIQGSQLQQVFWFNSDTGVVQQLTSTPTTKQRALMFRAPEFLGLAFDYMLVTLAGDNHIEVYQQTGVAANGAPVFTLYNTIFSPDPAQPYMFDPKMFVHCTPTCHTYVVTAMSQTVNSQFTQTKPNGLGVMNVDPLNPLFKVLVRSSSMPLAQRFDPEYFITANGPFVYYDELTTATQTAPYNDLGFHFVDMGLGPSSGPCVGSSAEDGLAGPGGICQ